MKWRVIFLTGVLLSVGAYYVLNLEDPKMTHIVFRIADSKVGNMYFRPETKKLWLVGNTHMRMEEELDPEANTHNLHIVVEPDMYRINRIDNTAQHRIDSDPSSQIHVPVLTPNFRQGYHELEFGRELEFFKERNAHQRALTRGGTHHYQEFILKKGNTVLTLLIDESTGNPFEISFKRGKDFLVIQYDTYESGLEPDLKLFEVPADVKIT